MPKASKTEMQLHPLSTLFPRMVGKEFDSFKEDIKINGQREPIIIVEGMILDGGNRYRACIELGIEPNFMTFGGENIVTYILSANLHRRHLSVGQQAAIVASMQDWEKAHPSGKLPGNVTGLDTVAKRMAVSGASDKTQREADKLAKKNPELAKKVARGEIPLAKATESKRTTVATPKPEPEQPSAYDPRAHELEELKASFAEIAEENEQLRDAISVGRLSEINQPSAAEVIAAMRTELKTLRATNSALLSVRDDLMRECEQLKSQCQRQQKQLDKNKA